MDEPEVSFKQQLAALATCLVVFIAVYYLAGWYACGSDSVSSFIFPFEKYIPFLPWMVVPYMSSGLLFAAVFFTAKRKDELVLLFKRMIFITVVSGICFILFPLRYSFQRPPVSSPVLNFFFGFLNTWDNSFNQAPSLHISYACLFWSVLSDKLHGYRKIFAGIWIFLMGISTLTVYQHHLIDIITSLMLVCITFFLFPGPAPRNSRIAMIYFFIAVSVILLILLFYPQIPVLFLLVWPAVTLAGVGRAYLHTDSGFLKRSDGTIGFISGILYFPYIAVYGAVRHFLCRKTTLMVTGIYPGVFIGPMPDCRIVQEMKVDRSWKIIDLTAELEECKILRTGADYFSFPMLDIATVKEEDMDRLLDLITRIYVALKPEEKIYIHCMMGHSRSVFAGAMFIKHQLKTDMPEAFACIKSGPRYDILKLKNTDEYRNV